MANDSITTVLSMVAWGTKLTFGLYDYSAANAFAAASEDLNKLAREVNLLSQVLRQIGSRLKEEGNLPSQEAFDTVRHILEQCQDIYREIEQLMPVARSPTSPASASQSPQMSVATLNSTPHQLEWNVLSQTRAKYLMAHIESMKMTLSVMLQTLYTAKTTAWARYDNTQTAYDAVLVEKLQMESLVIEQQLSLLRAFRSYQDFKYHLANAPRLLEQGVTSQALVKWDDQGVTPRALVPYQERSLSTNQPSGTELEDLAKVRLISSPYADLLLSRWTRINEIEEQLQIEPAPRAERWRARMERRNWQAPAVESDSEDDNEERKRPPRLRLTTEDPILLHVNEKHAPPAPYSAPTSAGLQPPGGPFTPQPSNSWGPTSGAYFPQSQRRSPGPSPLSSPRASFSSDTIPSRPKTAFKVDGPPQQQSSPAAPAKSQPQQQVIPWRLRINQWYWDHHDENPINSNTRMSPTAAMKSVSKDTIPITEVFQQHVSREAIRDRGYEYTKIKRKRDPRSTEPEETCYCIDGRLSFNEIMRLVELSKRIRGECDDSIPKPRRSVEDTPRSPRTSRGGPVLPPPLDRSNTAPPVYTHDKFRSPQRSSLGAISNSTTTSDEDATYRPRNKSRSRRDSGTYEDRERERDRDRGSSRSRREKEKRKGGGSKVQALSNIAAGAGLATLLDGLPEVLSYL